MIVVFLLAGEAAARLLEPGLSSAGAWPRGRIAEQYDAVMERAEAGDVDVVFAGSSMMQKAVDPELFSRQTGLRSINAALPASTNFMLGPWLEDVVLPMLHPDTVVIGVASRDFNDNGRGPDRALASFVGSPGYRTLVADDWLTDIDRAVSEYSALVRVRRSLRDPANVAGAIGRSRPSIPTLRCPPAHPGAERYRIHPTVARYPTTVLNDYSAGGVQTTELIDTITSLGRRGVEVVLVEMALPTTRACIPIRPKTSRTTARHSRESSR